jgi:hypothetical protein
MKTQLQFAYDRARAREALTVAEFEEREGLPQFSVYPDAQTKRPFMYREMTPEEREKIINHSESLRRYRIVEEAPKRAVRCGVCGEGGHNKSTCSKVAA